MFERSIKPVMKVCACGCGLAFMARNSRMLYITVSHKDRARNMRKAADTIVNNIPFEACQWFDALCERHGVKHMREITKKIAFTTQSEQAVITFLMAMFYSGFAEDLKSGKRWFDNTLPLIQKPNKRRIKNDNQIVAHGQMREMAL